MVERFLEGNRKFIEENFSKDPDHYGRLATGQSPTALWIACSDSRVNPECITSARMGDIFVHRNIGNIVPYGDKNLGTVLEYAVNHLKVKDIVVCGHSDCGAMKALDHESNEEFIPVWLENASEAKVKVDQALGGPGECKDPDARKREIEFENIHLQLKNLRTYQAVKSAEKAGKIKLHGMYYDLATGLLEIVEE